MKKNKMVENPYNIKLVAVDMDGTFLRSGYCERRTVSDEFLKLTNIYYHKLE
ncbi:hypothetical protein RV14_GL001425 [Enterococcus ratti]|uniref:Uncharacterized protein n=1 Tax=Enterococcus ratti TaxID=150033 RepID=A0A1L8WR76_9ENTE|nr:hypothetical protein RV14_GL001425 [Enterococcus ratti]